MRFEALPRKILKSLIAGYAYLVSPLLGPKCRFYPSCSRYALDAIEAHGALKGCVMSVKRLLKCHPWHKGEMLDPVPVSIDWKGIIGYKRANTHTAQDCSCSHHKMKE